MKSFSAVFTGLNEIDTFTVTISIDIPGQEVNNRNYKEEYLDIKKCSDFTGLSRSKLYSLVSRKQIPFLRYGHRIYFMKQHLQKIFRQGHLHHRG